MRERTRYRAMDTHFRQRRRGRTGGTGAGSSMDLLLVDPEKGLPQGIADMFTRSGWAVRCLPDYAAAAKATQADTPDAIIVPETEPSTPRNTASGFRQLLRAIEARAVATVLVSPKPECPRFEDSPFIDVASAGATKEEIRGRLATMMRYHSLVCGMERELRNMRRLSNRLNQHFADLDQEMRLAGRLQRDFLPGESCSFEAATFHTLFRPASAVSGDIYDIYRVDEDHVAFYVADAVGHGVAAGLLTMFIKKAIVSKRINGDRYELLDPSETMAILNDALAGQELPNYQFVTACYCLLNTKTLELRCCRGGHPYPFLVKRDHTLHEIRPVGSLLGLFPGEKFTTECIQLKPGQKLILYTDGLEVAFSPADERTDELSYYREAFEELCRLPVEEIISQLDERLNAEHGSINPRDDVTVVAMEVPSPGYRPG
jgi:sigma-B regulation protein RsbU (phosphoserine phosphatase)